MIKCSLSASIFLVKVIFTENQHVIGHPSSWRRRIRGTQRQFSENVCSEDDLRSRLFGTFVVKFLACLPLLVRCMAWSSWSTSIISWSSSVAETRHYEFGESDHCLYNLFVTSLLQSISARKKKWREKNLMTCLRSLLWSKYDLFTAWTACCGYVCCHDIYAQLVHQQALREVHNRPLSQWWFWPCPPGWTTSTSTSVATRVLSRHSAAMLSYACNRCFG